MTQLLVLGDPTNIPTLSLDWSPTTVILPIGVGIPGPAGHDGAGAPLAFTLVAAGSYSAVHAFYYQPEAWFVGADGESVSYGLEYPDSSHVAVNFPSPFTGTMYLR